MSYNTYNSDLHEEVRQWILDNLSEDTESSNEEYGSIFDRTGILHSEETKKEMSMSSRGKKNGFYGKTHSPEVKKKISRIGTKHSPETRLKMAESQKKVAGERKRHKGKFVKL